MLPEAGALRLPKPFGRGPCLVSRRRGAPLPCQRLCPAVMAASPAGPSGGRSGIQVEDFFSPPPQPYDLWAQHARLTDRVLREVDAMQQQMESDFRGAVSRAERLAQRARERGMPPQQMQQEGVVQRGDGWQAFSREGSFEERTQGGFSRGYYRESVTVFGPTSGEPAHLPVYADVLPGLGLLLAAFLAGAWAAMTAAFRRGYHLTTFSERKQWQLLLLWPLLLLVSKDFRQQFWAALRGRRPEDPAAKAGGGAGGPMAA